MIGSHVIEAPFRRFPSRANWLWSLLLLAATILAYQKVWHAGFIWDDDHHLTQNPAIVGAPGFKSIWLTSAATYYPLTLTTFWIEHALWGLNAALYHVFNVLVHVACALVLWRVLVSLHVRGAWLGAALWALHPVQVESVAWITELKNTQSCFFYLLSILVFLKWRETRGLANAKAIGWPYVLALLCAVLAILSKSSTVMLPVVLGLCSWWMDGCWRWRNVASLIPFFLISAAAAGWTIWEQKFHSGALGVYWTQTWPERLIIAGCNVWFYLGKLAWPRPLAFIYPRWKIDASQALMYLPILAAVVGFFILSRARNTWMRPLFFAAAYFVISLFPVLGFFNVYFFRYSFVGDHFQYLASMGPLALAGAGLTSALDLGSKRQRILKPAVCGALLLSLGLLTWRQCAMYGNDETLWRTTVSENPGSLIAHGNFGAALMRAGRRDEAIGHYQKALEIDPDNAEVHGRLGGAFLEMGRTVEAIVHLSNAIEIQPRNATAHANLGAALLQMGRVAEAIPHLQKALEIEPNFVEAHSNLGNAFLQTGQVSESLAHLQKAIELDPANAAAHYNLANTFLKMGRTEEAVAHLQKSLEIQPEDAGAHYNLGKILLRLGREGEANAHLQRARAINPQITDAQDRQ